MTIVEAILLGFLQGITEFLPISSSGHLVVAKHLMGLTHSGILFEVVVHLGTLISILVVFRNDLKRLLRNWSSKESKTLFLYLGLGTIPIAVAGLIFKPQIEIVFQKLFFAGIAFLVTGSVLILTSLVRVSIWNQIDAKKSILVGLSQAFALLPGISRSGMTISTGLFLGLESKEAARFSFLLAIPSILGSGILMIGDFIAFEGGMEAIEILTAGFFTSFVIGVIALKFLLTVLAKGKFHWFGIYCLVLGIISIGM